MTSTTDKDLNTMADEFQRLEIKFDDKAPIPSVYNEESLPININYLTPAMVEEARVQLGETEETRRTCLAELRKLIEGDKKMASPTDDKFLLAFLRARKFNAKRAFKLLQNYWSFRREHKKIYEYNEEFQAQVKNLIMRSFLGLFLHRDRNGCAVFVFKIGQWDPEKDSYDTMFRAITAILFYCLEHEATHICGFRVVLDARELSWTQLKYFTPANALLVVRSSQFCFPARYKGVHVLSENKMINFLWRFVNPFLTSKLRKRVFFHGTDLSPLQEYIHPMALPKEFGGLAPCFDNSSWGENIDKQSQKVREHLKFGYLN